MANWYYIKNGKTLGPVSFTELQGFAVSGDILPNDLVFKENDSHHSLANSVSGLFADAVEDETNQIRVFPPNSMNRDSENLENRKWMFIGLGGLAFGVFLLLVTSYKIIPVKRINYHDEMNANLKKDMEKTQLKLHEITSGLNESISNLKDSVKDMNRLAIPESDNLRIPGFDVESETETPKKNRKSNKKNS